MCIVVSDVRLWARFCFYVLVFLRRQSTLDSIEYGRSNDVDAIESYWILLKENVKLLHTANGFKGQKVQGWRMENSTSTIVFKRNQDRSFYSRPFSGAVELFWPLFYHIYIYNHKNQNQLNLYKYICNCYYYARIMNACTLSFLYLSSESTVERKVLLPITCSICKANAIADSSDMHHQSIHHNIELFVVFI